MIQRSFTKKRGPWQTMPWMDSPEMLPTPSGWNVLLSTLGNSCTWDRRGFLPVATCFMFHALSSLDTSLTTNSRLSASKWIYPKAFYIKSDEEKTFLKNTVLPVPWHHPLGCLPPNNELNQHSVSQGRRTTAEELSSLCPRRMDMRRHHVCMTVKQIYLYCY